jgi:hypothetical protein
MQKWSSYQFGVLFRGGPWLDIGGIYIFARRGFAGMWTALYIGQTSSFKAHIPSHERWADAHRLGATHVHARMEEHPAAREKIERELIAAYLPCLNAQFDSGFSGFFSSTHPSDLR